MNGGAFELRSARDLLRKLKHDLDRLKADPTNSYLAFNFFVTGHHMKDWVYHDRAAPAEVTGSWLLKTCSHLANGFKHFTVRDKRHKSVAGTRRTGGYFASAYFAARYFARGYFGKGGLIVELQGDAATELGDTITAVELAERVLAFWEGRLELTQKQDNA